jgi:hypothetical protein
MTALLTWIGIALASASCGSLQHAAWWDAQVEASLPPETPAAAKLARIFADRFSADESKRATARKLLSELPWDESMREPAWAAYKRDVRFTVMVGDKDTAYGRADRCRAFISALEGWKTKFGGYPGGVTILPGVGHSVPDRDMVAEMLKSGVRNPHPDRLIWAMSDNVFEHFYWLEAPHPSTSGRVAASAHDNTITLKAEHQDEVALWLDSSLVNLDRPITIESDGGRRRVIKAKVNPGTFCVGLEERGDPKLAAPARVSVELRP